MQKLNTEIKTYAKTNKQRKESDNEKQFCLPGKK